MIKKKRKNRWVKVTYLFRLELCRVSRETFSTSLEPSFTRGTQSKNTSHRKGISFPVRVHHHTLLFLRKERGVIPFSERRKCLGERKRRSEVLCPSPHSPIWISWRKERVEKIDFSSLFKESREREREQVKGRGRDLCLSVCDSIVSHNWIVSGGERGDIFYINFSLSTLSLSLCHKTLSECDNSLCMCPSLVRREDEGFPFIWPIVDSVSGREERMKASEWIKSFSPSSP